jgi:hypothetical protein
MAGKHLASYAAHARGVRLHQGEIGPRAGSGISSGAEPGGSGDNDIKSPDYSSMSVVELMQELCIRRLRSGETKLQLLRRLVDDDAKPADAQDESIDSSRGSE